MSLGILTRCLVEAEKLVIKFIFKCTAWGIAKAETQGGGHLTDHSDASGTDTMWFWKKMK